MIHSLKIAFLREIHPILKNGLMREFPTMIPIAKIGRTCELHSMTDRSSQTYLIGQSREMHPYVNLATMWFALSKELWIRVICTSPWFTRFSQLL